MAVTNQTGKAILLGSLKLLQKDPRMIWLPVMATVASLASFATISLPLVLTLGHGRAVLLLALACGSVVASMATITFNVALVFAATDRIEGRTPTLGGSLTKAWGRRGVIFRWAILSAVVGTVVRSLEQRFGLLGRLLGIAGGLAWIVATFMVVPVLAFEEVGPIEAVKRSSHLLKERFGTVSRSGLRFGALYLGASIAAMTVVAIGLGITAGGLLLVGIPLAIVGCAALLGVGFYAGAAGIYMRTILYRFATNQSIPDLGVDVHRLFTTQLLGES